MSDSRISIVMSKEDHKYLKLCCIKHDISIKDFVSKCVLEKIEMLEDECLFENSFNDNEGENHILIDHQGKLHAI